MARVEAVLSPRARSPLKQRGGPTRAQFKCRPDTLPHTLCIIIRPLPCKLRSRRWPWSEPPPLSVLCLLLQAVHAAMLDSLQWVAANCRLCIACLALLPPIFAILHLLHFLIFVPEDDEDAAPAPASTTTAPASTTTSYW